MTARLDKVLNRLGKWRTVFASWQLGTRLDTDAECKAVKDHREATMMLRVEVSAVTQILARHLPHFQDEFEGQLEIEALKLMEAYEKSFPGFKASDFGMIIKPEIARKTMEGWRP